MSPASGFGAGEDRSLQVLWADGEYVFCRREREDANGDRHAVLAVLPAAEHPTPDSLHRLTHEYALKDDLDEAWAVRPLELVRERGQTMLLLKDPGGEPLDRLIGRPMAIARFLRLAIALTAALGRLHERGLIHKDLKPAHVLVKTGTDQVWLMGFGIASRLPRERQAPEAPEVIAGTLAYMAPEQTGRMNRSIDARSDLYALGVTFYQMLTGALPFTAAEPIEWVHCHIARKPIPPAERRTEVPGTVSAIIMKLLAKTAEERYQTAAGLEHDLRRCLAEWEAECRIDAFPLGAHDTPDRLLIPETLYGREREIEILLAAFDRVVAGGPPELVLVAGYSGIGKSAVVNELHRVLVPPRGLFASGKFDQYKRDIPYSTLAQAFQSLVQQILGKSDAELSHWRAALQEALGPNGQLMVNLVPELALIIGEPPPAPDLAPQDQQARFQLVFRRFLGVFARPEHPLALFLDDLQWLDAATLDLIEHLATHPEVRHLLLIGAYRDNEVTPTHPLTRRLAAIRSAGGRMQEIVLAPLGLADVGRLIADALRCAPERVAPLARLVHEKTAGNPFFTIQFLLALAEEALLAFDSRLATWTWDLPRIRAKGFTDNVADLMGTKLRRLAPATQSALGLLACLGNVAEAATLTLVHGGSEEAIHAAFWDAVRSGLVLRADGAYAFLHDRIQEAAYALIPEGERAMAHLRIGRVLAARTPAEALEETIFDIVNQFGRGAALITAPAEREQVAALNLRAGQHAKAATAYASALQYFAAGRALLGETGWDRCDRLTFDLELNRAECEYLTGELAAADERLAMLAQRARTTVDSAAVTCARINLYTTLDQSDRAIAVGLDYLRHMGIDWSPHPPEEEARREYERIWSQLGSRTIEELFELPLISDPESLATVDLLIRVAIPAFFTSSHLFPLATCRAVNLSLEHGNSDAACAAYELLGMFAGPLFGNYDAGFRFGRLGCELVEKKPELKRFQARTLENFGFVIAWTRHVLTGRDLLRRALDIANRIGDLIHVGLSSAQLNSNILLAGDPLVEAQGEAESGLELAHKLRFGVVVCWITGQLGLIRSLRGLTTKFGCFDDGRFNELEFEAQLSSNPALALPECWYWTRKLQARFFAGDYVAALDASSRAEPLLWTSMGLLETAEYHFYGALVRAASSDIAAAGERQRHLEALTAHHRQLEIWAEICPENFENRAALVGAEIARVESRAIDAERLYEEAIRSARANGFVHNEAIAYELAARFYAARGFDEIARLYLRNARRCYLRWGADGKVRQLDELYPQLREDQALPGPTSTIGAPVEHLDLATVIKVSQAVSGEIVLEKLLDTLMRTALEQTGAERGTLVLALAGEQRITAEATTSGEVVSVHLRDEPVSPDLLPVSVLHYALRTQESVILDDAAQSPFAADAYIRQRQTRSVLCLPLLNQARLIGVLYLENNLAPRVFVPARLAVLKLLASQAAVALENARLYKDLAEREARIRRLVDSDVIGICIWDLDGHLLDANDAFLRMLQYEREDLQTGLRWFDMTPPEWQEAHILEEADEIKTTGMMRAREKEFFRKDGSRVPVLIGAAAFDNPPNQGVAYILDLTERKRAEAALRDRERELSQLVDMVPSYLWRITPDGVPVFFNKRLVDFLGLDVTGADKPDRSRLDAFIEAVIHPDDALGVTEAFERSLASGERLSMKWRMRRADGVYRWMAASAEATRGQDGRIAQWYGLCHDIDDQMHAEEALRQSERRFRDLFHYMPIGLTQVDASKLIPLFKELREQGVTELQTYIDEHPEFLPRALEALEVEEVNQHIIEMFGAENAEAMRGPITRYWQPGLPTIRRSIEARYRGEEVFQEETKVVRMDGSVIDVLFTTARPGAVADKSLVGFIDITERKRAEEALRESERRFREAQMELAHANRVATMGQLTASIAHEVNQPIAAAVTNAQAGLRWLGADPPDLEEVRQAFGRIVENTGRAGDVIGRIRALIKKAPSRKGRLDLNEAVRDVIVLTGSEVLKHGVSAQTDLATDLPLIEGDRVQLQQVILNLIMNAVEAMSGISEGPRELRIGTETEASGAVSVTVRDSGPGLDPQRVERLFEAFYTTKPEGLGMGLTICRSIIEAHGGRLWASANEPRGAVFQFTLPSEQDETVPAKPTGDMTVA